MELPGDFYAFTCINLAKLSEIKINLRHFEPNNKIKPKHIYPMILFLLGEDRGFKVWPFVVRKG